MLTAPAGGLGYAGHRETVTGSSLGVLCKAKNRVIAEYALRDIATPVGVSEFKFPTVEEIEAERAGLEVLPCTPVHLEAS
jgi:hypothetical protein